MDLPGMINKMKNHPEISKAGMVLYHNGVVRATSREGQEVTGLEVTVNQPLIDEILAQAKARPGIVEVMVHIESDKPLMVGDDVTVTVLSISGNQVRIGVTAPRHVPVHREEIYERVFPTPVGMNRRYLMDFSTTSCVPHNRGDEPTA